MPHFIRDTTTCKSWTASSKFNLVMDPSHFLRHHNSLSQTLLVTWPKISQEVLFLMFPLMHFIWTRLPPSVTKTEARQNWTGRTSKANLSVLPPGGPGNKRRQVLENASPVPSKAEVCRSTCRPSGQCPCDRHCRLRKIAFSHPSPHLVVEPVSAGPLMSPELPVSLIGHSIPPPQTWPPAWICMLPHYFSYPKG